MDLKKLRFVSEKREKDFNKLNIFSQEDLIRHFPRNYLDLTSTDTVASAYHNDVILTLCEVVSVEVNRFARRPYVKAMCRQGSYLFSAIWFNQPYVAGKLSAGEYLFYGRVQNRYGMGASMVNPSFERADNNVKLKGYVPVYPLAGSLTQGAVRSAVKQALSNVPVCSAIPAALQKKYGLGDLAAAYRSAGVNLDRITVTEGGSRDALWNQIKSDMLEATVVRYRNAGGAVLTNALFGAWATSDRAGDVSAIVELLSKAIVEDAEYKPDPETSRLYEKIGAMRAKLIREDMRKAFRNLVAIRNL